MSDRLATSIGKTQQHSVTFEVSDEFLREWDSADDGTWSEPLVFRFEKHEDGTYDLVMRKVAS